MPQSDGTGPLGKGPMTGRNEGFCILRKSNEDSHYPEGFAGLQGKSVGKLGQILDITASIVFRGNPNKASLRNMRQIA